MKKERIFNFVIPVVFYTGLLMFVILVFQALFGFSPEELQEKNTMLFCIGFSSCMVYCWAMLILLTGTSAEDIQRYVLLFKILPKNNYSSFLYTYFLANVLTPLILFSLVHQISDGFTNKALYVCFVASMSTVFIGMYIKKRKQ